MAGSPVWDACFFVYYFMLCYRKLLRNVPELL